MTVMPTIVKKNLGYTSAREATKVAGFFFTSFFYGLIIGSFFWPSIIKYTSKRNVIFFAVFFQMLFNAFQGSIDSIYWLCFCRFMCGMLHNLNTVGKDFIFEFAEPEWR